MNEKLMSRIKKLCEETYPEHNWTGHLIPVVDASLELSDKHSADKSITEPGAYLHDIGRVKFKGFRHELTGYYYSRFKLWQYGCDKVENDAISHCVLTHSGYGLSRYPPETLEAHVVMNADAVSHFREYTYLFAIHMKCHPDMTSDQVRDWVLRKLKRSWDYKLTLPGVKEEIESLYDKIKQELGG